MKKLLLAGALILCNSFPVMSANVIREQDLLIPVTFTVDGCDGIPINFSGHFRQTIQIVQNENVWQYSFSFNAQGLKGTDILGRSYVGSNTAPDTLKFLGGNYVQTATNTFLIIGKGGAPDLTLTSNFHLISPEVGGGSYVDNYRVVCR
ncbi:hypothetical protein HCG51_34910 (plasmid) [Tolypothrix sp. PCC 7910]|uniref:hypothetical protein n=1 Tax=Tolypothrix sp. PCC 7910 TaxID=2099387 RepID=UPI00142777A1|nr:hypothetical protein [Tolypothrix sp. PCC 7910]QIR41870.1 hypothetical protein HCG51_34910 [Tolypothrix sp. PCC 7910]